MLTLELAAITDNHPEHGAVELGHPVGVVDEDAQVGQAGDGNPFGATIDRPGHWTRANDAFTVAIVRPPWPSSVIVASTPIRSPVPPPTKVARARNGP